MPMIQIDLGSATKEKKKELIETFTKEASRILGFKESDFVMVVRESPLDNWGVGGKQLSEVIKKES